MRAGMSVSPGMTLARINGLRTVWLEAAVPEVQAGLLEVGRTVEATFAAYPDQVLRGKDRRDPARGERADAHAARAHGVCQPEAAAQARHVRPGAHRRRAAQEALVGPERSGDPHRKARGRVRLRECRPLPTGAGRGRPGRWTASWSCCTAWRRASRSSLSGQFLIDSEASMRGVIGRMDAAGRAAGSGAAGSSDARRHGHRHRARARAGDAVARADSHPAMGTDDDALQAAPIAVRARI